MVAEYSLGWIFPIIVLSLAVAWFKFRKISRLPDISFGLALLISSLRFLTLFFLLFLLLKPAISFLRNVKEKPLLIIAQDNSVSLIKNKDSLYYNDEYRESLDNSIAALEQKFQIERFTFGSNVTKDGEIDFSETHTYISGIFDYIDRNYTYKRPAAMLLLTDGIYNAGINPRYKLTSYPVYTVALGDTVQYPDVYIKNIECDKFNFINTIFPVKAEIAAIKQNGKRIKCVLKENGNILEEKQLLIDRDNYLTEVIFDVTAKQKGVAKYTVDLQTEFTEHSRENNLATVFVNIIDNSGDISIYYSAPHPDIAAVTDAIKVSGMYRCTAYNMSDPIGELKTNLIIMHNPEPGNPNFQKIVEWATKHKVSIWYIQTNRENISRLARFTNEFTVDFSTEMNEYATINFNRDFPFFEFTEQEISGFADYPPLVVPFGEIKTNAGRSLFTQKIKTTATSNGMFSFYDNGNSRRCYIWGDGLWKWRLYSYRENGNHDLFNTLVNKTINYLAAQRGTERFIHDVKPLYDEMENAVVNVELYNDSYELVNTPDVNIILKYGDKEFNYILNRNGDKYRIDLGNLPAGEYNFILSTNLKGEKFEKKGNFYVRTQNPELNNVVADKQLLKEIAENSGGKMIEVSNLKHLTANLNADAHFKPVYKSEIKYIEFGEIGILGIILLILICTEWFLLKYFVG